MPNITVPIADTYNSITLPVMKMMADEVRRICMINEDTPIKIGGERGVTIQPGTAIGQGDAINYGELEKIYCTATELMRNSTLMSTPVRSQEHTPFIFDETLPLSIRPVYFMYDAKLEFTYFAQSKNAAERWRTEMAMRIAESRGALQHTLLYNLTLNDNLLGLLHHLYTLREGIAGYGQTFKEWFDQIQVIPFHAAGTTGGSIEKIAVQAGVRQADIQGTFEVGDIPVETRIDDSVLWEIQFTYNFSYNKPVSWFVAYPLMVHQQHIDPTYFDDTPRYSVDDLDTNLINKTDNALNRIRWDVNGRNPQPQCGLRYPYYDEWYLRFDHIEGSKPVINWMIQLDVLKPREVLDLKDLPDMDFTPNFLRFLLASIDGLTTYRGSFVRFTLYDGDIPLNGSLLTVDDKLVINTAHPLSMRGRYHLRMSFMTSHIGMCQSVIETLLSHPLAALELFQTLLPSLDVEWAAANAIDDEGHLALEYFEWVIFTLSSKGIGYSDASKIPSHRNTFVNPIPEVSATLATKTKVYQPEVIGYKDPGSYNGRNTPKATAPLPADTVLPLEMMNSDEINAFYHPTRFTERPMNPSYTDELPTLPMLNNRGPMLTVQHLSIFTRKRT